MLIADEEWFDLQFTPELAATKYGIELPSLPTDEVQITYTAQTGYGNLREAFEFYKYASLWGTMGVTQPKILDFGGGWGRISRFFLRDTRPENIYIADTAPLAIEALRNTGNPCRIILNTPRPPIVGLPGSLDLVYAYSVFSHLSEEYFQLWVDYSFERLRPGGHIVFTTRGQMFIDYLKRLHAGASASAPQLEELVQLLREAMPLPAEIERIHRDGQFQFFPLEGFIPDFYGEAFIPKAYLAKRYGNALVDFREDVPNQAQAIAVLRKPY